MPSIALHIETSISNGDQETTPNCLPSLLQTPSGLAILEIQGTIHAPFPNSEEANLDRGGSECTLAQTLIGRLEFPLLNPESDSSDLRWMKRVYLYVGKHQRLTGEVKKLSKPLVIVGKRPEAVTRDHMMPNEVDDEQNEELEILEIIKHKILFGGRPEPVGE